MNFYDDVILFTVFTFSCTVQQTVLSYFARKVPVDPYIVLSTENKCSETHTGGKAEFFLRYTLLVAF